MSLKLPNLPNVEIKLKLMKILSVCVGLPRIVEYNGEPVATAIYKEPVAGKVRVGEFNLEGDRQADLRVHGGYSKAVYVYPSEHYEFWRDELPEMDLPIRHVWRKFNERRFDGRKSFHRRQFANRHGGIYRHRTAPTVLSNSASVSDAATLSNVLPKADAAVFISPSPKPANSKRAMKSNFSNANKAKFPSADVVREKFNLQINIKIAKSF